MFLKKTFLFGLMLAALAWVPLPNNQVSATEQSYNSASSELAWHGRWGGGWGGRWGGWGGYGYYRPYYNYYPYYYSPYYYYPYYYRYWY